MATIRSRTAMTDILQHRSTSANTRRLQEGLYTHLDQSERTAFIEALNTYGVRRDIFELVNSLRKILNTPVKRQLFPLVRGVIRKSDTEAFGLLTRGNKSAGTLPRPILYRPHAADLSVLRKHRSRVENHLQETSQKPKARSLTSEYVERDDLWPDRGHDVRVFIHARDENYDGFGFNIRGGAEYGLGVYVSSVDEGSPAEIQGLQVGDMVVETNDISFLKISHKEAAKIIQVANKLDMTVRRVGRVRAQKKVVHEPEYKWVDPSGRPVSPPPDLVTSGSMLDDADIRSRSSMNLLKGSDERKVNMVVEKGHSLGLIVRGGREYGLGIYIAGVDPYSVAENAGIKVGDQILDVNGESLVNISHRDAVRALTKWRHMVLTVKDVGRVPYAKATADQSRWQNNTAHEHNLSGLQNGRISEQRTLSEPDLTGVGFSRWAGSQLMLSTMSTRSQRDIVETQARVLLNNEEQATLRYYLSEYGHNSITVLGVFSALTELFNTPAKFTLMSELRGLIQPKDLSIFDSLLFEYEQQTHQKSFTKPAELDVLSLLSWDSADGFMEEKNKRTLFSSKTKPVPKPKPMEILTPSARNKKTSVGRDSKSRDTQRNLNDPQTEKVHTENGPVTRNGPLLTKPIPFTQGQPRKVKHHHHLSRSRSPNNSPLPQMSPTVVMAATSHSSGPQVTFTRADVHVRGKNADDPSDDSGVEVSNPQLLDPHKLLGLGGSGGSNRNRPSRRVSVSNNTTPSTAPRTPTSLPAVEKTHSATTSATVTNNVHGQEEAKKRQGWEQYGNVPLSVVYIYRCKPTLGMAIEGGANTRQPLPKVINVQPGGSAFESGGLKVGHVILEVNGVPMAGKEHTDIAKFIAEAFKDTEQNRMELLVTEASDDVMETLRENLSGLKIVK